MMRTAYETNLHPCDPRDHLPVVVCVVVEAYAVFFVVLLAQIEHDGTAFEHALLFALCLVHNGRYASIR